MNRKQPDGSNETCGTRQEIANLHETLRDAAMVLGLTDAVRVTGAALLNRIPRGAPSPTSPASVAGLAAERECDARTIRNHIGTLIQCGLVENRCLDGGRRHCQRDHAGDIIAVHGIDFTPLAQRAPELAGRAGQIRDDRIEATRLRHEISRVRRNIRHLFAIGQVGDRERRTWAALPRRIAHMGRQALELLMTRVQALYDALRSTPSPDHGRNMESDRSEKIDRPYTTYQDLSEPCNPAMPAKNKEGCGQDSPQRTCGLEHVTLNMALTVAPDDWRIAMEQYGGGTWRGLVATAYERATAIGLHASAWAQAEAILGRPGAALLVLLADAQCAERGGNIRSPGGWVRRMSERAETGAAHLHRSVFGLLHRQEVA